MNLSSTPSQARHGAGRHHWQQGLALAGRSEWAGAASAFERATRAAPRDVVYWINLANAQRHAGDYEQAVASARRILRIDAAQPLALRLIGECCSQLHRYAEAVEAFERLEATGVQEPDAMALHGANLQALRRPIDSIKVLMRAAAIDPSQTPIHAYMSTAFRDMAMQKEAIECLKTVLALDPDNLQALSHLLYEKRHVCDWAGLDEDMERIAGVLASAPHGLARVANAFSLLSLPLDPQLQLAAARGEALASAVGVVELPPVAPASRAGRKTRIGMLSYDFREHPVAQLIVEVLEQFDRGRMELFLYSTCPDDGSALRQRLVAAADAFVDLRGKSDAQAAERIRADGIDLLVDLQGHTRGQRLPIFARRPAPVQVAFLGYPGSTGAPYIDYLVGDPLVTPLELAPLYSEKLAQMPLTFQPNGRWRPLPQPMTRAAAGLPEGAFVMCAFNHTYKILPEAFDSWCAVMREVPRAVLWLKETNAQLHDNVRAQAAARGVDAARVVFAKNVAYAEHFSRLALADVFVDTWPYNAHTTAADALWAGVPVVTMHGNTFASRVAASVLNAAGMAELAFATVDEYRRAIVALALDAGLLASYRRHLEEQRVNLALFDSARYTRELQALLARMVDRWREGRAPEHLTAQATATTL